MTTSEVVALIVAIVAEVAAGILVAIESAVSRTSAARAEELADDGVRGAASLLVVVSDPARYITTVLFVRIVLSVLAVVLAATLIMSRIERPGWAVFTATVVMAIANFILLGVAPRTLGRQHFSGLAVRTAGFVRVLGTLLYPITKFLVLVGNAITPGKGFSEGPFASEAEIRAQLARAGESSVIPVEEQRMLESVFELGDTICREIMVPRTEMVYIERDKRLNQALSLGLRSGFTRIPVIGEHLDDVVGTVNIKDVMNTMQGDPAAAEERVQQVMRAPLLVPDTKRADDMLRKFQATSSHMAILVDEYGGTAGLVTVEDIVEEIVGEIADEHDAGQIAEVTDLGAGSYRVSARLPVDEFGELIGVDLSADQVHVDTVAGVLSRRLGLVPIPGSTVEVGGYRLTAETAEGRRNRIATVLVELVEGGADAPSSPSS
ncbi:MAG: hemolysin family protein [Candidatus Nanopelagicales bacterium]